MKECPLCGEQIQDAALKCRFCGEMVDSAPRPTAGTEKSSNAMIWIIVAAIGGGLLMVLAVVGVLVALLLPAVQQGREAARLSMCKNNMKQIGLALHNYHETYASFPPAYVADENGRPMHSWRVLVLPFLEEQFLYEQYDFSQPWDSPANQFMLDSMPMVFRCPSNPNAMGNTTHYAGVFGPNAVFTGAEGVKIRDITDGTSNTLIVGEVEGSGIPWTKPQDIDVTVNPGIGAPGGFNSSHPGGVHFLLGDGSVRFVSENIDPATLDMLFTRDGGEVVGDF